MDIRDPMYLSLKSIPGEIWKDVKGFEGSYQVSSEGRVKSKERYAYDKSGFIARYISDRILTPCPTNAAKQRIPTYAVTLASSGKDKHHYCRSIKHLVADAFLEKDEENTKLVTIDNPYDFRVDNLLYITPKEFYALFSKEDN